MMEERGDFSEAVIEAVRQLPALWDKRSKDYAKKKSSKELEWVKVAQECGSDVASVKEKWRSMRDYYVSRRRKVAASGAAASQDSGRKQLGQYGRLLSFLDPVTQRGSTSSSAVFRATTERPASAPAPAGTPEPATVPGGAVEGSVDVMEVADSDIVFDDGTELLEVVLETYDTDNETPQPTQAMHESQDSQTHHTQRSVQDTNQTPTTGATRGQGPQDTQTATLNTEPAQAAQTTDRAQPSTPGTSGNNAHRVNKRKVPDVDKAIMEELSRGREKETDRDHTFCRYLYAELKHRSEATKKVLKRKILDLMDEYDH